MPDVSAAAVLGQARPDITLTDADQSFIVKTRGQQRRFSDPRRDCAERSRNAAVFAVLVIDPLRVPSHTNSASAAGAYPDHPSERDSKLAAQAVSQGPARAGEVNRFTLELGPVAQAALLSDAQRTTFAGGLGLRLRYGSWLAGTLGVAALLPTSLHFAKAEARANWVPFEAGVQLSEQLGNWELSLELALRAALLVVAGEALNQSRQATRLELGPSGGLRARYWATPNAGVFLSLQGSWIPQPYTLQVLGLGAVGQTPTVWTGVSLGAVMAL